MYVRQTNTLSLVGLWATKRDSQYRMRYTSTMTKKPLTNEERQAYVDSLPDDQKNENAEQIFDEATRRAAQPKQSTPEKSTAADDDYNDTQTHSDTAEDTSH